MGTTLAFLTEDQGKPKTSGSKLLTLLSNSHNNKYLARRGDIHRDVSKNPADWQVQRIFFYGAPTPNEEWQSPEKPQIGCLLFDEAPLVDGILSTSELNAIVWLAAEYFPNTEVPNHTMPVSIIPPHSTEGATFFG